MQHAINRTSKGEPVKKAKQLTDAPTLIVLKPGEILMPNPPPFKIIQRGSAKRKAREAQQKIIDRLLRDAHR